MPLVGRRTVMVRRRAVQAVDGYRSRVAVGARVAVGGSRYQMKVCWPRGLLAQEALQDVPARGSQLGRVPQVVELGGQVVELGGSHRWSDPFGCRRRCRLGVPRCRSSQPLAVLPPCSYHIGVADGVLVLKDAARRDDAVAGVVPESGKVARVGAVADKRDMEWSVR